MESDGGAGRPLAAEEEEVLKRNTDCVYFLASPLTCKKVIFFFVFLLLFSVSVLSGGGFDVGQPS